LSQWFTATFRCEHCNTKWDETVERALKDEAHSVSCPGCHIESVLTRTLAAPMVGKESLPDGQRRKTDGAYGRMKDAIHLERKGYNHPPDSKERKELFAAADKLKKGQLP